jgi:hypothetical protein
MWISVCSIYGNLQWKNTVPVVQKSAGDHTGALWGWSVYEGNLTAVFGLGEAMVKCTANRYGFSRREADG